MFTSEGKRPGMTGFGLLGILLGMACSARGGTDVLAGCHIGTARGSNRGWHVLQVQVARGPAIGVIDRYLAWNSAIPRSVNARSTGSCTVNAHLALRPSPEVDAAAWADTVSVPVVRSAGLDGG